MKEEKKVDKKVEKKVAAKEEKKEPKKVVKKATKKAEEAVKEEVEKKVEKAAEKKEPKKVTKKAEKAVVEEVEKAVKKKTEKVAEKKEPKKVAKKAEKAVVEEVEKKVEKAAEKKEPKKVTKKAEKAVVEEVEKAVKKKTEKVAEKKEPKKVAKKAEKEVAEKVVDEAEKEAEKVVEEKAEKKVAKKTTKKATKKDVKEAAQEEEVVEDEKKAEKKAAKKKSARKGALLLDSILDLNANNIWNMDEFSIAETWEKTREKEDFTISEQKLLNTIRLAFDVVHYDPENERDVAKYENGGWANVTHCQEAKGCVAIRRKVIERITDLSYENIRHISTAMLLELINRNFGGGWDSIALAIRDIIETGFEISTTQLPQSRIHAPGGTVEKKKAQGFDVLEIQKGTWVEAIFAKKKDIVEKIHMELPEHDDELESGEEPEEEDLDNDDTYYSSLTPEENVEELEEGLSVEDIAEGDEDE